ncbi:MAG: cytochrome c biogenesis protein CcsA, partial [Saprospiraceae bacterium]|nr:cytochrome c biogenesis protein CcsA [Saprospiraceae bacterium]
MKYLNKISKSLFSTSTAGLYMILFAISIGAATFIENDFGTSSAQKIVFQSKWFELLLALFAGSLLVNVFRFRMIQNKKWAILTFHLAIIVILFGAGITRYTGSEGVMHIRENSISNTFLSSNTYLQLDVIEQSNKFHIEEPVSFATLGNNHWEKSYLLNNEEIAVEVIDFIPNPTKLLVDDINGVPILKVVIGGMNGREEYYVKQNDRVKINGLAFNFGTPEIPGDINIKYENESLVFKSDMVFTQMQMATQKLDTLKAGIYQPLFLRSLYSSGEQNFVIGDFNPKSSLEIGSSSDKMGSSSLGALVVNISNAQETKTAYVYGRKGIDGNPTVLTLGNKSCAISYGAKQVVLPFSIKLRDFIMEKYPGTNSASSYASEITLNDPRENLERDQRIYMNHILKYGGYRFFQSSFDQDELGTYLSVNHDAWGTRFSYLGYFLLTLGMLLTFVSPKSRFRKLASEIQRMRLSGKTAAIFIAGLLTFGISTSLSASSPTFINALPQVDAAHANHFGKLIMQDHRGRFKPMETYTNEILRKLCRKEEIYGFSSEQVVLSIAAYPGDWYDIPLIKIGKSPELLEILNIEEGLASYGDFFNEAGDYLLRDYVRAAYNTQQQDRGSFEKELLKLDERVNICSMIFSGRFMRAFPVMGDPNNEWVSPADLNHQHNLTSESSFIEKFYPAYIPTLQKAIGDKDWNLANQLIDELMAYQQANAGAILPSASKVKAELLLNNLRVFSRLSKTYGLLGLTFLVMMFLSVFKPSLNLSLAYKIAFGVLAASFFFHTLGLGLRWYVSGRAPWSNGYESMIYIAWTTMLAGLLFTRNSYGGLAATNVLSSTILMVAGLSWLDPEITPLVPVLKSYWLTIHVSLEAGSYGFLMLGAIIGILNLIFMILARPSNKENINRIIKEMTKISEMTLIGGLIMVSIGTYLGGVWANESWGRYWGWDAKETWALVTILVYAFILHMRFIPGLRGNYAFNVASLFGFATVMMTYFGV